MIKALMVIGLVKYYVAGSLIYKANKKIWSSSPKMKTVKKWNEFK